MGVIKIGSTVCGPCKAATMKLDKLGIHYTDIDAYQDGIVERYSIRNIPTIIKTDEDDNELFRLVGGDCLKEDKLETLK